jgi:hypothetical protein
MRRILSASVLTLILLFTAENSARAEYTPATPTNRAVREHAKCKYRFRFTANDLSNEFISYFDVTNVIYTGIASTELIAPVEGNLKWFFDLSLTGETFPFSPSSLTLATYADGSLDLLYSTNGQLYVRNNSIPGLTLEHECPAAPKKR